MNNIEKITESEIYDLVGIGEKIVSNALRADRGLEGSELASVTSWVTRLGQLIRKLYGKESQQFENYSQALATQNFYNIHSNWNEQVSQMLGVAMSVQHDFENGLLRNIRTLLQADIFADFLEMGEYLLKEKYKDAAAVIIGAVLEDSLRKLCEKNGIATTKENGSPLTIDPLNNSLAKANVYSKLVQKQIITWTHIRNKAAHGEYDEYDMKQTELMLLFVQNFTETYLT
ncbi:MAG: hypothetical protein WC856_21465 [Methylococcaceae bacterium]|jgi:hypothetical protein